MTNEKLEVSRGSDLVSGRDGNWDRREFVKCVVALAGSAGLLGYDMKPAAAEPPPEVRKIRIAEALVACQAPLHLAEELLRAEGFVEVEYIPGVTDTGPNMVAKGLAEFTQWDVGAVYPLLDDGKNLLILAGVHAGCQEFFANERVRTLRDLKGKRIAISARGNGDHVFVSSILAYVGINPRKDVTWVAGSELADPMKLFIEGNADALMAFEPQPHELREKKVGHVILNTTQDRPWSQYFCCMLSGNREFVQKNPVATKRVLRAILKAADICSLEPERAARFMADKGYEKRYEIGLEILKGLPYKRWREADPEDTLRFHALRLHEVGLIKTSPQKLIAQGTDWRFLNEIKRELKA